MNVTERFGRGIGGPIVTGIFSAALLAGIAGGMAGCKSQQPGLTAVSDNGPDPADANMAPVEASDGEAAATGAGLSTQPAYAGGQNTSYPAAPRSTGATRYATAPAGTVNESQIAAQQAYANGQQAPVEREAAPAYDNGQGYQDGGYQNGSYQDSGYDGSDDAQALSNAIYADVDPNDVAQEPPPPLPVYDQPPAPADNYLWTPGYWNYAPAGYYWVPGAWVAAPFVGALWTPGWWGPYGGHYCFHRGYWGRYVGFYGGIPYGFGYYGTGYHGGYWNGNQFNYNRAVTNVNITNIRNVYNRTVIVNNIRINNSVTNRYVNNVTINNRVSYNGGRGGIEARPRPAEIAAFHTQRIAPMVAQVQNQRAAEANRAQFFQHNEGRPQVAAEARPFAADHVAAVPAAFHGPLRLNGTPAVARNVAPQPGQVQRNEARPAGAIGQQRGPIVNQQPGNSRAEQLQVNDQQRVLEQQQQNQLRQTQEQQRAQQQQENQQRAQQANQARLQQQQNQARQQQDNQQRLQQQNQLRQQQQNQQRVQQQDRLQQQEQLRQQQEQRQQQQNQLRQQDQVRQQDQQRQQQQNQMRQEQEQQRQQQQNQLRQQEQSQPRQQEQNQLRQQQQQQARPQEQPRQEQARPQEPRPQNERSALRMGNGGAPRQMAFARAPQPAARPAAQPQSRPAAPQVHEGGRRRG